MPHPDPAAEAVGGDNRSRSGRGILLMLLACIGFTVNSAATKLLTGMIDPAAILFYQYSLIVGVLLLCLPRIGRRLFAVGSARMQLLRAATFAANMALFIVGLSYLPFSTAAMLAFVNPIFVTLMAPLLLGEQVGWRRWAAVLVGLAGVVLIARPWSAEASWLLLLPLASAFFGALRDIITRRMTFIETSESMLFYSAVTVVVASGLATGGDLPPLDAHGLVLLALVAGGQLGGLYCVIESMRCAEASVVAPFKYSNLVWIIVADIVVWGTVPPLNVIVGSVIIVAAMLYIYIRERKRAAAS